MKSTNEPEVYVMIRLWNGDLIERRFDHCEDAWLWERKTRSLHAKRRAKADRVETKISLYAGCTTTGKTYGGILYGSDEFGTELPYRLRYEERRQANRHSAG